MLIFTSLLCTQSIDIKILIFICKVSTFFILALFCKVGYVCTYIYSQPFLVIFILLQLLLPFFCFCFFKSIGFKKLTVFIAYIYFLTLFIESCISYNITNIFSISFITISSIFTVIAVYKNFLYKENKTYKLSMFKEFFTKFKELFTEFYFLPKVYKMLIVPAYIISLVIIKVVRHELLYLLDFSCLGLTSQLFILFSLIVPSIIFFRIVSAVILHIRLVHGNVNIQSVIFKELFNVSHYNLNSIDLNLILTIFTLGVFSIVFVEIICLDIYVFNTYIQVNEGIRFGTYDYNWHYICSSNDTSLPTLNPTDTPSPTPTNSSFLSIGYFSPSPTPPIRFEEELWINRRNSLADAKALDMAKRILLHKICSARNIPNDIQMLIQDSIWGNHWYELYTTEHYHDEDGNILRLPTELRPGYLII